MAESSREQPESSEYRFARVPASVLEDHALTHTDIRVFASMAKYCVDTDLVYIGQRKLATEARVHRTSLRRSLRRLAKRGHISCSVYTATRKRTIYRLNSPVFLATDERVRRLRVGAPRDPVSTETGRSTRPTYIYKRESIH